MKEKFEFTAEEKVISPTVTVRRIQALVDIPHYGVKAGDTGGFLQFAENLSHKNECWVGEDAVVYGLYTKIHGNALVSKEAVIGNDCIIGSGVSVSGNAKLETTQLVGKDIFISGNAFIESSVIEGGNIVITGKADIFNLKTDALARDVYIAEQARIVGHVRSVKMTGKNILVKGKALVEDVEFITGNRVTIMDSAVVKLNVIISGNNVLIRDAATVEGEIDICENVTLKECVHLYNLDANLNRVPCLGNLELGGDGIKSIGDLKAV